ncbi:hypothetical protein MNBD_GAMMA24-2748 [hydrothermal vent metagenome]|uniref:Glycosyltransferase n=1 Tax=hydrothermal vent metagenome TaxID=652676 RepID=A0A3B1BM46_9ZZZZ
MSYRYPDARILIFSKAPLAGRAKTRLIPQLGEQGAAEFSADLTRYMVQQAAASQLCPLQLWCEPDDRHELFQELRSAYGVELKQQQGSDLGIRMRHALAAELSARKMVVLIGSDCPAISADYLEQALQLLAKGISCVLGPAEDGGYVLVGQSVLDTDMFENVNWGTSEVLQQTRQRLRKAGRDWSELATLWDVDRAGDIARARNLMAQRQP